MTKKKADQTEMLGKPVMEPVTDVPDTGAPVSPPPKEPVSPQPHPLKKIKYVILGCGSIGSNLIEELAELDENILIIDNNDTRLQDLRDHRHQVMKGDMTDDNLYTSMPEPEVAFVLSSNTEANLVAVRNLHTIYPQTSIIARSVDPFSTDELADNGADVVLYPQTVFARSALNHMATLRSSRNAQRLQRLISGWTGTLGIITHKNPDPDAISSAMALAEIANDASNGKLQCRILYEGNVGHQENRAFVNMLDIKMERLTPEVLAGCDHLALVDCPGAGLNNDLPPDTPLQIIIDHHSQEGVQRVVQPLFRDIRPEAGATSSIMTQYIQELYLPLSTKVATALFYGIRSDTNEFQRNVHPQDMHNAAYLLPFTDKALLEIIMTPSVSKETLDIIGKAILNAEVKQGYLFSNVGYIHNRDALPQAADHLLNMEGVNTALVYGITDTAIVCSGRNRDVRLHLGDVMKEAFSHIPGASAGGHATMAALSISLSAFVLAKDKDALLDMIARPAMAYFEKTVGIKDEDEPEVKS
ncbi:MAG TPA: DHH family phosphoesterase [Methanocorpusculum sp.]|nr:DHH family phosphoesterase [Methanocorpusculum sp.]